MRHAYGIDLRGVPGEYVDFYASEHHATNLVGTGVPMGEVLAPDAAADHVFGTIAPAQEAT